jgi:polyketide synthase 13
MADTELDTDNSGNPVSDVPAKKTEMTVPELRQWLREWVGKAVGRPADEIDESVPMVELGLSSRDAVAMAADVEDMTGVTLSVAVAFQHPTIESLATRIIEGEPEVADDGIEVADWSRNGPAERVDIAGTARRECPHPWRLPEGHQGL